MKTKRKIFILLWVVLVGVPTLSAQSKREQRAEAVSNIIRSKNYKIYVNTYIPPYRDPIQLDYLDLIEIKNDSVFSNLLYLEASDIPYSDRGNQLIFQAPIKKYAVNIDKKGNAHIKFSTRTAVDYFNFKIEVYSNGSANISVTMQHNQSVSFLGELKM